jgi:SseB protein N-terminal domain
VLAHAPSLADTARDVAQGVVDSARLHEVFLASTVYCERGADPGFRALGVPHAGVVPVFSSVEQLALARGTVGWFSMTGADLLAQLPTGYDLVLDIAGPQPLRLRTGAMGVHATISLGAVG